jgi:hypothetical protein
MAVILRIVDSVGGTTVLFDLNTTPGGGSLLGRPELQLAATQLADTVERGTFWQPSNAFAELGPRTLNIPLVIVGTTPDDLATRISALLLATRTPWVLEVRRHTASVSSWLRCDPCIPQFDTRVSAAGAPTYAVGTLTCTTEPYAYGARVDVTGTNIPQDPATAGAFVLDVNGVLGDSLTPAVIKTVDGDLTQPPIGSSTILAVRRHGTPANLTGLFRQADNPDAVGTSGTLANTVSNKQLTSNVATLTIGAHPFLVGETITVALAAADPVFDGVQVITAIAATTVSYAKVNANIGSTSSGGTVTGPAVGLQFFGINTVTNKALTSNVATLTIGAHALLVGQSILVALVAADPVFDGTYTITAVTTTTVSYARVNANVGSTASGGTVRDSGFSGGAGERINFKTGYLAFSGSGILQYNAFGVTGLEAPGVYRLIGRFRRVGGSIGQEHIIRPTWGPFTPQDYLYTAGGSDLRVIDLGLVQVPVGQPQQIAAPTAELGATAPRLLLNLYKNSNGAGSLEIDWLALIPADESHGMIAQTGAAATATDQLVLDAYQNLAMYTDGDPYNTATRMLGPSPTMSLLYVGGMPVLAPGNNRIYVVGGLGTSGGAAWTIATLVTLTVSYWPRYAWLL